MRKIRKGAHEGADGGGGTDPDGDPFDGMARRRLIAFVRARFSGRDDKGQRIAARYGWSVSKAYQIFAGTYARVSADDLFRVVAADGAPALQFLFDDLFEFPAALQTRAGDAASGFVEGPTRDPSEAALLTPQVRGETRPAPPGSNSDAPFPLGLREKVLAATAFLEEALAELAAPEKAPVVGGHEFGEAGSPHVTSRRVPVMPSHIITPPPRSPAAMSGGRTKRTYTEDVTNELLFRSGDGGRGAGGGNRRRVFRRRRLGRRGRGLGPRTQGGHLEWGWDGPSQPGARAPLTAVA